MSPLTMLKPTDPSNPVATFVIVALLYHPQLLAEVPFLEQSRVETTPR
jgi:hypothetical protein